MSNKTIVEPVRHVKKDLVLEFVDYIEAVRLHRGLNHHQFENLAGMQLDTWALNIKFRRIPTWHRLIAAAMAIGHRFEFVHEGVVVSTWDALSTPKELSTQFVNCLEKKRLENKCPKSRMEGSLALGVGVWKRYIDQKIYPNAETILRVASAFGYDIAIEENVLWQ